MDAEAQNDEQEQETRRVVSEQIAQENCALIARTTRNAIIQTNNNLIRDGANADLARISMTLRLYAETMLNTMRVHVASFGPKPLRKITAGLKPTRVELIRVPLPKQLENAQSGSGVIPGSGGNAATAPAQSVPDTFALPVLAVPVAGGPGTKRGPAGLVGPPDDIIPGDALGSEGGRGSVAVTPAQPAPPAPIIIPAAKLSYERPRDRSPVEISLDIIMGTTPKG